MSDAYRDDLAHIHNAGFAHYARGAIDVITPALQAAGLTSGVVADLGCGGGTLAEKLLAAGYDAFGVDISPAMIAAARQRVPRGVFKLGSVLDHDLPACVGVCAVGEVFNYLFDEDNSEARRHALFERIYAALAPTGVFIADFATSERAPDEGVRQGFRQADDWAVLVEHQADASRSILTRHITTFRQTGALFRRDREVHRLRLLDAVAVQTTLSEIGFAVERFDAYGDQPLPAGWVALIARKP